MYLTHNEYVELGGILDNALFTRLEYQARKIIDKLTQRRIINDTEENRQKYAESLKMLVLELVILLSQDSLTTGEAEISSTNNDGVVVSYRQTDTDRISKNKTTTVLDYLNGIKDSEGIYLLSLSKAVEEDE